MKKIIYVMLVMIISITAVYATATVARDSKSPKLVWQWTRSDSYDPRHNVWTSYKSEQSYEFVRGSKWSTWVVRDKNTWLYWESKNDAWTKTWEQAKSYCEALDKWWKTNWRLPTIWELESLVDYSRYSPAINTGYFSVSSHYYWSSVTTADGIDETAENSDEAWYLDFSNGYTTRYNKIYHHYVLCVAN